MASLLIVDDERQLTDAVADFFERHEGHSVTRAYTGEDAIAAFHAARPDLVLLDMWLPDITGFNVYTRIREQSPVVIMIGGEGDTSHAVQARQHGAESFVTKPVELNHLALVAERALEKVRLRQLNGYLSERRRGLAAASPLGTLAVMRDFAGQLDVLAANDGTTVLLLGEAGSGKGRVAELIHAHSPRKTGPFVEVNCAASPGGALEVALFGQDVGSNGNGIAPSVGLLEVADGGTLFLDEIGELDAYLQGRLLRLLDTRTFRRVGDTREITANVRIIAATNKDLVTEVNEGRFREDLYYRVSVMPLYVPPLRARSRDDLAALTRRIVDDMHPHLPLAPRSIGDDALDRLVRHAWPANVRELHNALERAMIVARGADRIEVRHLPSEVRDSSVPNTERHVPMTLEEIERAHIERALEAHKGNRTHTASELGISRATLIKKIKEYRLNPRAH